jgi:hypothetical protein
MMIDYRQQATIRHYYSTSVEIYAAICVLSMVFIILIYFKLVRLG